MEEKNNKYSDLLINGHELECDCYLCEEDEEVAQEKMYQKFMQGIMQSSKKTVNGKKDE
jgi:hypothetical protein